MVFYIKEFNGTHLVICLLLKNEVNAWNKIVNKKKLRIKWKFTTKKARKRFKYDKI